MTNLMEASGIFKDSDTDTWLAARSTDGSTLTAAEVKLAGNQMSD